MVVDDDVEMDNDENETFQRLSDDEEFSNNITIVFIYYHYD